MENLINPNVLRVSRLCIFDCPGGEQPSPTGKGLEAEQPKSSPGAVSPEFGPKRPLSLMRVKEVS
jgi:hypothetical protein